MRQLMLGSPSQRAQVPPAQTGSKSHQLRRFASGLAALQAATGLTEAGAYVTCRRTAG